MALMLPMGYSPLAWSMPYTLPYTYYPWTLPTCAPIPYWGMPHYWWW